MWAVRAVGMEACGCVGSEGRAWSCWGSNRTLFFLFWRSFLISWRKGRHEGGEGGGHGSMWAVGAVGVVGAVWVVWRAVGSEGTARRGGCVGA